MNVVRPEENSVVDTLRSWPYTPKAMAKLPSTLITKPKPVLREIEIGETVFAQAHVMRVTAEMDCFLLPTAPFERQKSVFHILRIKRAADGFHVAVLDGTWEADTPVSTLKDWLPVASIIEDFDPDVDIEARRKKK